MNLGSCDLKTISSKNEFSGPSGRLAATKSLGAKEIAPILPWQKEEISGECSIQRNDKTDVSHRKDNMAQ